MGAEPSVAGDEGMGVESDPISSFRGLARALLRISGWESESEPLASLRLRAGRVFLSIRGSESESLVTILARLQNRPKLRKLMAFHTLSPRFDHLHPPVLTVQNLLTFERVFFSSSCLESLSPSLDALGTIGRPVRGIRVPRDDSQIPC